MNETNQFQSRLCDDIGIAIWTAALSVSFLVSVALWVLYEIWR